MLNLFILELLTTGTFVDLISNKKMMKICTQNRYGTGIFTHTFRLSCQPYLVDITEEAGPQRLQTEIIQAIQVRHSPL